jgi:hypothetical protein
MGEMGTVKTSLIEHYVNGKFGIIKIDRQEHKNLNEVFLLSIGIPSLDWNKELQIFTQKKIGKKNFIKLKKQLKLWWR